MVAHHESFECGLATEVQRQANTAAGRLQIVQDLRLRAVLDRGSGSDFDQDDAFHDNVRAASSDDGFSKNYGSTSHVIVTDG